MFLLPTHSDAFPLSRGDLLSVLLAVPLAGLETNPGTAAVIDLFTIIQDPDVETHLFIILVKSIACCREISDRKWKSTNSNTIYFVVYTHGNGISSIFMVKAKVLCQQERSNDNKHTQIKHQCSIFSNRLLL